MSMKSYRFAAPISAYLLNATWFTSRHDAKQSAYRQQQQQADEGAIPPTENKVASGI